MLASPDASRISVFVVAVAFVIGGLLLLDVFAGDRYWLVIGGLGLLVALSGSALTRSRGAVITWLRVRLDWRDLAAVVGFYLVVVAGLWLAFRIFTVDNVLGLFLSYGATVVLGVAGPLYYTAWLRRRPLAGLGLGLGDWRATAALAIVFAGVQFAITLARVDYPALDAWLPLAAMALPVGLFEAVFFRGFVQNRLEAAFGVVPAVALAAALYGLYHVGYGMGVDEIGFLVGLGIVYAVAFRLAGSIVVLWPLLTPMGAMFNQIQAADITMPMVSILGFADLLGLQLAAIWWARRQQRRTSGAGLAGVVRRTASPAGVRH